MYFEKLDANNLTQGQFRQIVHIESRCGLHPYTPMMLFECIAYMDTFACFDDKDILGFITMSAGDYLGGSLYIVNINVVKPHRGKGIAKMMMLAACRHYSTLHPGIPVTLDVAKTNPARGLYEKVGFVLVDTPSRNGDTDVVMATSLGALTSRLEELTKECGVEK